MTTNNQFICDSYGPMYEVQAAGYSSGSDFWYEPFAQRNDAGVRVNAWTALGNCHVWKALSVLAGDLGQLPVKLYRKQDGRSVEVEGIAEIECLRDEPNPWMLPSVWKETAMWVAALRGNSLNWVFRPTPQTIRLVPLRQDRVEIQIDNELTGDFYYVYRTEAGATVPFDREEILHIPGLSVNGIWGLDLLEIAKNVIGGDLAVEKHMNRSFANGTRPGGVLSTDQKLDPEAKKKIRENWASIHEGSDNAGRIAVLSEGMNYTAIAMSMEAAQVEELRRLGREFVASLFNLPLFKLNSLEHSATRANLEQQQQEYLYGSLMRWLNRFAEEFRRKILSPQQRKQGYYYRWITEALLRGDTQSRYSAYGIAISNRIMNPNEVREKEDMPPYEGGNEYGNPNIDPKKTPEEAKAANDADNAGGRPPGSKSADSLIAHQTKAVIKAESAHINRAAADSQNFVKVLDKYYDAGGGFWSLVESILLPTVDTLSVVMDGYRFDSEAWAMKHAAESKRLLLKACDQTTKDRLTETVKAECATWEMRCLQ